MKNLYEFLMESVDNTIVIADKIAKSFKSYKGSNFDFNDKESLAEFKNLVVWSLRAIRNGYIEQEGNKFGISEENFINVFEDEFGDENLCKEVIKQAEKNGYTFRFKTDSEWKKAGYKHPDED